MKKIGCLVIMGFALMGAASDRPAPQSVWEWMATEHRFLQRYLAVIRQASHDYRYDYKTPALLMPVAMDLFTGYVAHVHAIEEQCLYPVLRPHLATELQQKHLALIESDQRSEGETAKRWAEQLAQHVDGEKWAVEAETIDYLGQLVNRHLVLQEKHLFPALETLTPEEQAVILANVANYEQQAFGTDGRERNQQLLDYIEEQIKLIAGRIW